MERRISVGISRLKYVDHPQRWSRIFRSEETETDLSIWIPTEISGIFGIMVSTQWVLFPLHPQYFPLQPFCVTSNKPPVMETSRCHCHVLINIAKRNSIAIFFPPVLTCQKREISLSVGCKIRRLGMIVTSFRDFQLSDIFLFSNKQCTFVPLLANLLAHNKKLIEKSVFREAWSPEMTSQSFPVSLLFLV